MRIAIIYDSQYGNTRQIAETIADELAPKDGVQITCVRSGTDTVPDHLELLIVGGPTQVHRLTPQLRAKLDALPAACIDGVPAAAFDTRVPGWQLFTGAASGQIARRLVKRGARVVARPESFLVSGTEGPLMEGELARARKWAREVRANAAETLLKLASTST